MLSRRGFLAASMAVGVASRVRAQTGDAAPTVLRLERRDIAVNGKSASEFCIRQPDGSFGITSDVGTPFLVRVENYIEEPDPLEWPHSAHGTSGFHPPGIKGWFRKIGHDLGA